MNATRIQHQIERLQQQLTELGPMHPGSLGEQYNVCGKAGCRCKDPKKPQKHGPYSQLSYTWRGKSTTRFVRPEQVAEMRRKVANYKRFRELVNAWVDLEVARERAEGGRRDTPVEIDTNPLPKDPAALQQMVRNLLEELESKERRLKQLQHWVEQLLRARYGPRRERVNESQLFLFAVALVSAGQEAPPDPAPPAGPPEEEARPAKPKGHGRQPLPRSLERRRVVYELGKEQRECPQCQGELKRIGEEVSERLEYVPASLVVIEEVCQKYACPKGCTVVTAEKPMAPIEKGLPGPGLLAQVAVSKYGDHCVPRTHRQRWRCGAV